MHLNVQPEDKRIYCSEVGSSVILSVQYWLLVPGVSLSVSEAADATRAPLCGTVGLPPSYRGAHGGRTGYYHSLGNTVCVSEPASSLALRVDNVRRALALRVVDAHVWETVEQVVPSVRSPRDRARHHPGGSHHMVTGIAFWVMWCECVMTSWCRARGWRRVASTDCRHADDSGGRRVSKGMSTVRLESVVVIAWVSVEIWFSYFASERSAGGRLECCCGVTKRKIGGNATELSSDSFQCCWVCRKCEMVWCCYPYHSYGQISANCEWKQQIVLQYEDLYQPREICWCEKFTNVMY